VLIQATPQIDQLIRRNLELQIMNRIDSSALTGSGVAPNPTGIANQSGIETFTTAGNSTITHSESLDIVAEVASNNISTQGGYWIVNPTDAATIGATSKDSGSGTFVYENGRIAGFPVIESNHATAGTAFFGVFEHCYIGFFGGLDIVVDPYSSSRNAVVHITATQLVDVAVAHAGAFSKVTLTS
jgi:HK97 family phage major capsid protein